MTRFDPQLIQDCGRELFCRAKSLTDLGTVIQSERSQKEKANIALYLLYVESRGKVQMNLFAKQK